MHPSPPPPIDPDPAAGRTAGGPERPSSPWGLAGVLALLAAAYAATGFYTVQPNEQAAVVRFGRMLPVLRGPGPHLGLPAGMDRAIRLRMQEPRRVAVDVRPAAGRPDRDAPGLPECLTGDRALLNVSAVVQYGVTNARAFLFSAADVPRLVSDAAAAGLSAAVAAMKADDLLAAERIPIQDRVRRETQTLADRYGLGVQIVSVALEEVAPPEGVAAAFRAAGAAREDRRRTIDEARDGTNRLARLARGEAEQVTLAARGEADETVQRARAEAESFRQMVAHLDAARELTILRLILETAEEVLPRMNKVLVDGAARRTLDLGVTEERP